MPAFHPPQTKQVTLTRPLFVKGKGLPKHGTCLANAGDTLTLYTDNGHDWYAHTRHKGRTLRVATLPHTL